MIPSTPTRSRRRPTRPPSRSSPATGSSSLTELAEHTVRAHTASPPPGTTRAPVSTATPRPDTPRTATPRPATPRPASPYGESAYGPTYGQPAYTPPNTYQYESIRSNSTIVIILAALSFFTFGLLMSVPAWVWGHMLVTNAQTSNAPMDVLDKARMGRLIAMIISIVQILGMLLFIVIFIAGLYSH